MPSSAANLRRESGAPSASSPLRMRFRMTSYACPERLVRSLEGPVECCTAVYRIADRKLICQGYCGSDVAAVTKVIPGPGQLSQAVDMDAEATPYLFVQDAAAQASVPEKGILSQTLQNDDRTKVILFHFAAGQELSAHTAPFPATLMFLKGDARLKLGPDEHTATPGTFVYMPPKLEHGIRAQSEVVMLLTIVKNAPAA